MLLDEIGQCPALDVSLEAEWCEPTHSPGHAFCARRRRREQGAACRAPRRSAFYRRFGFVAASKLGIAAPDPAWGSHFQARVLSSVPRSLTGTFRYASPFAEL